MTLRRGLLRAAGAVAVTFATLDPAAKGTNIVLSEGDLRSKNSAGSFSAVLATISKSSGRWYWEGTVLGPSDGEVVVTRNRYLNGIGNVSANVNSFAGSDANSVGVRRGTASSSERFYNGVASTASQWLTAGNVIEGSVFMFDLDVDSDTLTMGLDGTFGVTIDIPPSTVGLPVFPMVSLVSNAAMRWNFGQSAFTHTVPVGANPGVFV